MNLRKTGQIINGAVQISAAATAVGLLTQAIIVPIAQARVDADKQICLNVAQTVPASQRGISLQGAAEADKAVRKYGKDAFLYTSGATLLVGGMMIRSRGQR